MSGARACQRRQLAVCGICGQGGMKAPDGKIFERSASARVVLSALRGFGGIVGAVFAIMGRAIWKFIITTWRVATALDSALWRASKLLARKFLEAAIHTTSIAGKALYSLLLWLPTRTGRAYSAVSGFALVIMLLWIVDELRAGPGLGDLTATNARAPVDEDDPILARIGARYVHLSEIEAAARAGGTLQPDERLTSQSAFTRGLVEAYVEQRLLARAALDDGMQRRPTVVRRINAARDRVLAASLVQDRIDSAINDEVVERFYLAQRDVTVLGDEVRARHILVATGAEADEIMAALEAGQSFSALARERSIDRATAPLGGEMGWFTRAMMTPAFSRTAFKAKPGEVAPPFQTEVGWHIIEVIDRRPTQGRSFSQVREDIEAFLRLRIIDDLLKELETQGQVVYFRPADDDATGTIDAVQLRPEITDEG